MRRKHRTMTRGEAGNLFAAQVIEEGRGFQRRHTELFLLGLAAIPVLLLYSMYVLTTGNQLGLENLGVPLGLLGAFACAHMAHRLSSVGHRHNLPHAPGPRAGRQPGHLAVHLGRRDGGGARLRPELRGAGAL